MPRASSLGRKATVLILCTFLVGLTIWFRDPLITTARSGVAFVADRERVEAFITSFGWGAPLVFMLVQILQVLLAPIPGEATGFIGGYLFGTFNGFIYSSFALAVGSWLNFSIGRFLGERFVRRWIPSKQLARFDRLVKRQGVIIVFLLFVFPGFPKDWLSLFMGMSTLPLRVFILLAAVGRMPGTLLLSLQGAYLYEKNYTLLVILITISLALAYLAFHWRERLYQWVDKYNNKDHRKH